MENIFLKIGFNTAIQLIGKGISVILSFLTVSYITRYLGTAGYGNFALAFSYVSFFSVLADFGMQVVMVRELSQIKGTEKPYGTFFLLKTGMVVFSSVLATVILLFVPYDTTLKNGIIIAIAAVAISGITNYGTVIFQSRVRADLITYVDIVTRLVTVMFLILFVYLQLDLYFIIGTVLLGNLIGLLMTFVLLKDVFYFRYQHAHMKRLLVMSIPIGLMSFAGLVYFKIDTILLSFMRSTYDVGIYSLSYKVLENLLLIWGFYMASVFPLFARMIGEKKYSTMKNLLKKSLYVVGGLSLLLVGGGYIFTPTIIEIIGGSEFRESAIVLKILLFSLPFLFMNNLLSDFCIAMRSSTVILISISLALLVNVFLNILFIPLFGVIGAAYVTVISAAFQTMCSTLFATAIIRRLPNKNK